MLEADAADQRTQGSSFVNKRASSIAKGIAILFMLWHHLFYSKKLILKKMVDLELLCFPIDRYWVIVIAQTCKICVAVFVFVTGYGTYLQVTKQTKAGATRRDLLSYCVRHHAALLLSCQFIFVLAALCGTITQQRTLPSIYGEDGLARGIGYFLIDWMGLAKAFGTPTYNKTWWYLSLATLLIYLIPVLTLIANRIGSARLLAGFCAFALFVIPFIGLNMRPIVLRYMPSALTGMVCAQYQLFDRDPLLKAERSQPDRRGLSVRSVAVWAFALLVTVYLRRNLGRYWFFEAITSAIICRIAISLDTIWGKLLDLIGRHSSNIFMSHTFIYSTFFSQQLFSLQWCWLIFAALVVSSLLLSMGIDGLKRLTRFDRFTAWVDSSIAARLAEPA